MQECTVAEMAQGTAASQESSTQSVHSFVRSFVTVWS